MVGRWRRDAFNTNFTDETELKIFKIVVKAASNISASPDLMAGHGWRDVGSGVVLVLLVLSGCGSPAWAYEEEIIGAWAEQFGEELWNLGRTITKVQEIKQRYKLLNAKVEKKNGETLLDAVVDNVNRMLGRKMDAVKCLMMAAESEAGSFVFDEVEAENFTYYSSKKSSVNGETRTIKMDDKTVEIDDAVYRPLVLSPEAGFSNIPVNTTHSAVHVPTNVFDKDFRAMAAIQWSEKLDDVFLQNYYSDPALSWQYFGDTTGVMRTYPAMEWNQEPDLFDCRTRFWYIEAATCTKDVIILMDNSGSMKGMRRTIAMLTVNSILDTLGNNDFVNVFNVSEGMDEVVPCYKDMLVQATLETVNTFKEALQNIKPEGHANLTYSLVKSFQLLEQYREMRGCGNSNEGVQCNQAIMLITDGVPGNLTEVFETYNRIDNGSHIPVRIFTYLVGREVTKVREIQWMACLNRGYYVHIHYMNEVREQVFKYINVIARPLVLQGVVHPITWTHAYADTTDPKVSNWLLDVMQNPAQREKLQRHEHNKELFFSQHEEDLLYMKESDAENLQEYQLMTSVSIPAFDRKVNSNNESRIANLLGVAGTDVPIADIEKLTFPYKMGVNGYCFIVTNNGFILSHPDLRPVSAGILTENYNSVDLTEVELLDDGKLARDLSPEILQLRAAMINNTKGKMEGLQMRTHFDDMRRVIIEKRNYYFAPLDGTPFTMGIALPLNYGSYWLKVGDEIRRSQMNTPVEGYFQGTNWRIHPKWLYCKYHHQSLHQFNSTEEELLHFLQKMADPSWQWSEQYEKTQPSDDDFRYLGPQEEDIESVDCNRRFIEEDEYYCDKDLMQLLVFDGRLTLPIFEEPILTFNTQTEEELTQLYNITLRFIATHSGLTRWQTVYETNESSYMQFGDFMKNSVHEAFYKAAVVQHEIDPESFVFSVPFNAGEKEDNVVTGSYAIFHRDGGQEAPASVVGLQFDHSSLFSRFMAITSKANCLECQETCASEELDCYVLDNNGFVVISEILNDTGRFFGEVDGAVMEAMKFENIYRKIHIFDFQALCTREVHDQSAASFLMTPINHASLAIQWLFGELMWLLFESSFHHLLYGDWANALPIPQPLIEEVYYDEYGSEEVGYDTMEDDRGEDDGAVDEEGTGAKKEKKKKEHPSCDKKVNMYLLQQQSAPDRKDYWSSPPTNCSRPFFVKHIPHTNLVLVVVNAMYSSCYRRLHSHPKEINYFNMTLYACQKLNLNNLPRRRLTGCFSQHPEEAEIDMCGDCIMPRLSIAVVFFCWSAQLLFYQLNH